MLKERLENELMILSGDTQNLFSSGLSRLKFLLARQKISISVYQRIRSFRDAPDPEHPAGTQQLWNEGLACWVALLSESTSQAIPERFSAYFQEPSPDLVAEDVEPGYHKSVRISLLRLEQHQGMLVFIFQNQQVRQELLSLVNLDPRTQKLIQQCIKYLNLPFDAYAHQIKKLGSVWEATELVLLPDYLIDVTHVAGCFNERMPLPQKQLVSQFLYRPPGFYTLLGNTVNQFLDELIVHPDLDFKSLAIEAFQQNPIAFSLLTEQEAQKLIENARLHFSTLRELSIRHFDQKIKHPQQCLLEPSFYSVAYGIQGRLDVFYRNPEDQKQLIIELKSGKVYKPNAHGINSEHHAQIALYYLLIQSVFGDALPIEAMLLYSAYPGQSLRAAPFLNELRHDLIYLRNALIVLQLHLAFRKPEEPFLFDQLQESHFAHAEPFTKRDSDVLLRHYRALSPLEQDYFKEYTGFVAREQYIAKLGRSQIQYTEGLASLWLLDEHEKEKQFMILSGLKIASYEHPERDYPVLHLESPKSASQMANFRIGDTLVLYLSPSVLSEQIFKGSLIDIQSNRYTIRLRTRQFPKELLSPSYQWSLEHDYLDRSFLYQFQSLFEMAATEPSRRALLLGQRPPEQFQAQQTELHPETPSHLRPVLQKILDAKEYFLVWGPPGSGKTSMVIRFLVEALVKNSGEDILLLAYTNRAVDEICEVLEFLGTDPVFDYIRIGSRFAVHEKFRKHLLEERTRPLKRRQDITTLLGSVKIYTATVASIQGKKELFSMKAFDTVIIDEASQILESQIMGLLCLFKRFVLIGDHMQLPAVSAQTELESKVQSKALQNIGIKSLSMSYFERLFGQCQKNEWNHAYEMLHYQGRMHYEIMQYPAQAFYQGKLYILPDNALPRQQLSYQSYFPVRINPLEDQLASHRNIFIPCSKSESGWGQKTNQSEAKIIVWLVERLYGLYVRNQKTWDESVLGIITPFRAQIVHIQHALQKSPVHHIPITVDTAERYQGGARQIILLSTVITDENQLNQISSINEDGSDRKLNVALTRAKEQIILIGDPSALNESPHYRALIHSFHHISPDLM